ncbi:hypothetical protein BDZ89DRAFT_1105585 [Hymenopellis radicata]|nr:hypothetical protein BDZ89DRAFT_1105585 [Hymenopellis radicata]
MSTIELFPTPSQAPSIHAPSRLPGADDASTKALIHVLKDNHEKWHIFFNNVSRFHNHVAHHVLAIWALGANKDLIEAAYTFDIPFQKPVLEPTERITDVNFKDHLGDDSYHISYMNFFEKKIVENGVSQVLEEFVFSRGANITDGAAQDTQPVMLARFFAMLVHPLLHIGNGLEFGLPGMVVEGLALAAVHHGSDAHLLPASLFEESVAGLDALSAKILVLDNPPSARSRHQATKEVHAFDIIARIMKDKEFSSLPDPDMFKAIKDPKHSATIVAYANQWTLDIEGPEDVRRKIEELQWMNSLIYAVSGYNAKEKEFFADFYLMHLVTSSLFLPSFVAYLTPASQKVLIRGYFTISLAWFIARRPRSFDLDVTEFFEADVATPQARPSLSFNPPTWALVPGPSSANPWFPIIQDAIMHADDHVCKLQRAFVHFGEIYGMREAGGFAGTELRGAGGIDGSLFLRAAALTAKTTGRDFKDGEFQVWDR